MEVLSYWESVASIVAFFLTCVGTFISWRQALRSRNSARRAEEIVARLSSAELTELDVFLKGALGVTTKYTSGNVAGRDLLADADAIQDLKAKLAEYEDRFNEPGSTNPASSLRNELTKLFDEFQRVRTDKEKHKCIAKMHPHLETFLTISKRSRDRARGIVD
jgi:hypothetical protein